MTDAWIPISILGLPFIGMLALAAIYKGGTSASSPQDAWVGDTPKRPRAST